MKNFPWIIGLVIGLLLLAGCQPAPAPPPRTDNGLPTLRVGVNPDYPPVIFMKDGRISGLEADLARQLAVELKMNLEFVVMKWEQLVPALQDDKIDIIMSGMSVTKLRNMLVLFTEPYMSIGQMALVRSADAAKYPFAKALQLRSDRIGVKEGTTGEIFVREACPQATAVPFANPEDAYRALLAKRIDVMIYDAPFIWTMAARDANKGVSALPFFLTREQLAWAVNRGNTDLANRANRALVKWRDNGILEKIIKRWVPL